VRWTYRNSIYRATGESQLTEFDRDNLSGSLLQFPRRRREEAISKGTIRVISILLSIVG
jgi:hypothetical protein